MSKPYLDPPEWYATLPTIYTSACMLQADELDAAEFFSWEDAAARMPDNTAARIPAARRARKNARTVYLPADSAL
ncbi:hypothetical protein HS048_30310 [Planomonospora sp. ID91781]|uniref:hypothetical protein n=1 Tax=Planomonospora sp. ID91781 TaxID=2738135 RepID=UPI0018C3F877|nr:hypothetical protein [Planomonospora sp. ID91781]MBG0824995.1 hypothetical protein [Planomonospora sp. ID91781]